MLAYIPAPWIRHGYGVFTGFYHEMSGISVEKSISSSNSEMVWVKMIKCKAHGISLILGFMFGIKHLILGPILTQSHVDPEVVE